MKGSSSQEEERTCIFNVKHPCYFLEEALRPLLRCLGIESEGTTTRSQPQTPPAADSTTNSPTSTQKTSPDAQHPSFIASNQTIQCYLLCVHVLLCNNPRNYLVQQHHHVFIFSTYLYIIYIYI
uniref:Uncharacterized protein n=1 Tax=Cajanus cajan TaxID=3821 RepID=A0A151S8F7_CAJCA|nr:hypothetical protein KK1_027098 [Cajanus cajan]